MPIGEADENSIVFCSLGDKNGLSQISVTKAKIVLSNIDIFNFFKEKLHNIDKTILFYKNPKLEFVRILDQCLMRDAKFIIDGTARIDAEAKISQNVRIDPFSIIGKCEIGDNSIIGANSIIHDGTKIGKNVEISSLCCIGSDGFGFVKDEENNWLRFPHIGGVVIEDGVEIFPFCDISRGTLGNTTIRRGTKISFQVHIAHNCDVGEDCILTAAVRIAGSTKVGKNCFFGNGSIVRNKVTIGNNVTVGAGAVVVKDISDNITVGGNPAREITKHV